MISFKQFITEARLAPLYHGTSWNNGRNIIAEGFFRTTTSHNSFMLLRTPLAHQSEVTKIYDSKTNLPFPKDNKTTKSIYGLSTSRSYRFSKTWCKRMLDLSEDDIVIFELDQQKLTQKYQIKPISFNIGRYIYKGEDLNEYEEFIVSSNPIPLKYVTKIYSPFPVTIKKELGTNRGIKCEFLR